MFSTDKTFREHKYANYDNPLLEGVSYEQNNVSGIGLMRLGATVGDVILEMAKDASLAKDKHHTMGTSLFIYCKYIIYIYITLRRVCSCFHFDWE